jgi:hypothetical protein
VKQHLLLHQILAVRKSKIRAQTEGLFIRLRLRAEEADTPRNLRLVLGVL